MQNKGFVKLIAVVLTIICCFYLIFTVKSRNFKSQVDEIAATQGTKAAERYQDSILQRDTFLVWSMKDVRELSLGFGLDLEGGMNVILEVGVPDVLKSLAGKNAKDENFKQALEFAASQPGGDAVDKFIKRYQELAGNTNSLAKIYATESLRNKIKSTSSDAEVEQALREEVTSSIENSYNILRNRIDQFGVAQPNIQRLEGEEGRYMVELPGVKDPNRVRKMLQSSANLEFWECYINGEPAVANTLQEIEKVLAGEVVATDTTQAVAQATDSAAVADSAVVAVADSAKKDTANSKINQLLNTKSNKHTLAQYLMAPHPYGGASVVANADKYNMGLANEILQKPEVKAVMERNKIKLLWSVKPNDRTQLYELHAIKLNDKYGLEAPLEGDAVETARDEFRDNSPVVSMSMKPDGARAWAHLTKENINRPIAIVLDNLVYTAPNVNNEITGGNSEISGSFTPEETRDLVNVLKSGRMSAPAHIVNEEIVGPSLGQESINQGMWSCVIAFIILMVYMVVMYGGVPGMVANGALILNLFFTIGILSSFQAALTMSGIAGMVLSLGMAVDANVLIYERTKEEMKAGLRTREALAKGYSNAFSAIFDSNLTSIITGIILFNFGTGPIRGFATTLIIGIIVSFFTAVFLTRIVFEGRMAKDKWLNLTFTTGIAQKFFPNPNYKFMGAWKKSFTVFGILAAVSVAMILGRGFSKSIDFTGGRNFVVTLNKTAASNEIATLLNNANPDGKYKVIALGTDGKKVRISTNYGTEVNTNAEKVDSVLENQLFSTLKQQGYVNDTVKFEHFIQAENPEAGAIISSQNVGPSIADSITRGAILSVILAIVAIFLYILVRFRNVSFSVGATTALVIDVLLILGMYAICWGWVPFSLEIDQTFIGAILTAIGYSINDKVVVFDRIRENLGLHHKMDKRELFNLSLNTTLTRTLNTSISTFIVLAVIFVLGGDSIRSFAFAMILGVIFGTLSSIFVAAPTAFLVHTKRDKGQEKK